MASQGKATASHFSFLSVLSFCIGVKGASKLMASLAHSLEEQYSCSIFSLNGVFVEEIKDGRNKGKASGSSEMKMISSGPPLNFHE